MPDFLEYYAKQADSQQTKFFDLLYNVFLVCDIIIIIT